MINYNKAHQKRKKRRGAPKEKKKKRWCNRNYDFKAGVNDIG